MRGWMSLESQFKNMKSLFFLSAFQRIEQLLILYALNTQSEARINWLNEKIRLCRISRAITTVLALVTVESFSLTPAGELIKFEKINVYIIWLIPFLSFAILLFVTSRAYSRFCTTLFAMVYTQMRSDEEKQTEVEVQE
jgi:hypothetical protein